MRTLHLKNGRRFYSSERKKQASSPPPPPPPRLLPPPLPFAPIPNAVILSQRTALIAKKGFAMMKALKKALLNAQHAGNVFVIIAIELVSSMTGAAERDVESRSGSVTRALSDHYADGKWVATRNAWIITSVQIATSVALPWSPTLLRSI